MIICNLLDKCSRYKDLIKRQSVMIRDVSANGLEKLGLGVLDEEDEDEVGV